MSHVGTESPAESTQMLTALVRLRGALQHAALPLELPNVAERRATLREMVDQLEDYVIPRVMTLDAPLLAVVGGSTGAGKSTLVNSLVGTRVTEPGVLRPTTRSPGAGAQPGRRAAGSARTASCPTSSGCTGRPPTRRPAAGARHDRARGAGHPRRARRRLGRGVQPGAGRPAAGRRRPLDLRHLGGPVRRPGAVGLPAPGRGPFGGRGDRPRPHAARGRRHGRRPPGADARLARAQGLPAVHRPRGRGRRRRPAAGRGGRRHQRVVDRARRRRRGPRRPSSSRPWRARSAPSPGVRTTSPTPWPSRSPPRCGCARTPTAPTTRPSTTSSTRPSRRHPAPRRGAGAVAGVRRHGRAAAGPGDQGRLAARPARQRDQGQAAAGRTGHRSPSSPASRR